MSRRTTDPKLRQMLSRLPPPQSQPFPIPQVPIWSFRHLVAMRVKRASAVPTLWLPFPRIKSSPCSSRFSPKRRTTKAASASCRPAELQSTITNEDPAALVASKKSSKKQSREGNNILALVWLWRNFAVQISLYPFCANTFGPQIKALRYKKRVC